jgi:hypothetical protein
MSRMCVYNAVSHTNGVYEESKKVKHSHYRPEQAHRVQEN